MSSTGSMGITSRRVPPIPCRKMRSYESCPLPSLKLTRPHLKVQQVSQSSSHPAKGSENIVVGVTILWTGNSTRRADSFPWVLCMKSVKEQVFCFYNIYSCVDTLSDAALSLNFLLAMNYVIAQYIKIKSQILF